MKIIKISFYAFIIFCTPFNSFAESCITDVPEDGLLVHDRPFKVPYLKRNVETFNIFGKANLEMLNKKLAESGLDYNAKPLFEGSDEGLIGLFFSKVSGSSHDPYDNYYEYSLMIFGAEKENLFYSLRLEMDDPKGVATDAGIEFWGFAKKDNSGNIHYSNTDQGVSFRVNDRNNGKLMFEAICRDCKTLTESQAYKCIEDTTPADGGKPDPRCMLQVEERTSTIVTLGNHWQSPDEKLCRSVSDWYLIGETQRAAFKPEKNEFKFYPGTDLGDYFTKIGFQPISFSLGKFKMRGGLPKAGTLGELDK